MSSRQNKTKRRQLADQVAALDKLRAKIKQGVDDLGPQWEATIEKAPNREPGVSLVTYKEESRVLKLPRYWSTIEISAVNS